MLMDPADAPCVTILKEKQVKGRKEHTCSSCKKPIKIGARHHVIAYRDDDVSPSQFVETRWHLHCDGRVERFHECGTCYGIGCAACGNKGQVEDPRWRQLYDEARMDEADARRKGEL